MVQAISSCASCASELTSLPANAGPCGLALCDAVSPAANGTLEVELTREQQRRLALAAGENVFVRPRVLREFRPSARAAA